MNELFPRHFENFVEVFGGAGWVSVKSERVDQSQLRVYNDFNPLLANVFECLRTDPVALLAEMNVTPKSDSALFKQYQQELFGQLNWATITLGDIPLAVKYLYLQTQVFAGTPLSTTCVPYFTETKAGGRYPSKYDTLKKKLTDPKILARLSKISCVEQLDCCDLIRKYDSDDTFFYVDPPYYNMEFYYSREFPREKHQELATVLKSIRGKFALSYYDFDDLKLFYPEDSYRWHRQDVYRSASTRGAVKKNHNNRGTEVLIMNYDAEDSDGLFKF